MKKIVRILTILISLSSCSLKNEIPIQFGLLKKEQTGLNFENKLQQTIYFSVLQYMYFFNGGGIGAADFNKDGLVDLYFTANIGENKLFLNRGNLRFEDVTEIAGVKGLKGWTTGVSIVDINQDGLFDIYVSQIGDYLHIKGHNQLYVCKEIENGIPIFEDQAAYYGLDLVGFSTQAVFFDYDLDGDLDMFQMNHSLHQNGTFGQRKTFVKLHPTAGDKLMRNDENTFVDVTNQAKIHSTVIGYGLGIALGDINVDGWPDIYIGNDFHENDYLYINQQDGTFKEVLTEQIRHTSRFSMGVDIGDINNDGLSEIISLDMLPYDPFILKSSLGEDGYGIFSFKLGYGYNPQFAFNNLQLNTGNKAFKEIGRFAGIYATDWSWTPLFMDFDHDGYKDLFVSNGIPHRMNDIDYINYRTNNKDISFKALRNELTEEDIALIEKVPKIKLPNKFFLNTRNLQFQDIGTQILNNLPSFSNGAIYADLDNDGDLDIVVNNIEDEPYLYKNYTIENKLKNQHYLSITLHGASKNIHSIGARIIIFKQNKKIVYENFPVRGYQSAVSSILHIGIGDTTLVDSIIVIWPDRTYNHLHPKKYDTTLYVTWEENLPIFDFSTMRTPNVLKYTFVDITEEVNISFRHTENPFVEFNRERLIPHMISAEGPALAVGDINNDGLEDVFFGNSKRRKGQICIQNKNGTFKPIFSKAIMQDSVFEDVDAEFVDIENDGDLDLVVASGGNEYRETNKPMKQRAYFNDGKGNFSRKDIFSDIYLTASCILPADFDNDGKIDLFFGARAKPWNYGVVPKSFLLKNTGNGKFVEVTQKYAPELEKVGLVKNGAWIDIDKDKDLDLVLAVEWQPILIFLNQKGKFQKLSIDNRTGWWNFVLPVDFDSDGDIDILAGNLGKNSKFKPTHKEPIRLYVNDFDKNGQIEQILTYYVEGKEIPFANYSELTEQIPSLKKKYLYARDLASASLTDIFGKEKLKKSIVWEANTLQSALFENTGRNLSFIFHPLPDELQLSTLNAACTINTQNEQIEILLGGNFIRSNIEMGWYDADMGNLLSFKKDVEMSVSSLGKLNLSGQIRRIKRIQIGNRIAFILAKNNDKIQILNPIPSFQMNKKEDKSQLKKKYEKAIEDYDEAIRLNPNDAIAYHNRGNTKGRLEKYEESIKDFDKSIELNPDDVLVYINRGNAKCYLKNYQEGIEDYTKAVEIDIHSISAYYNRGDARFNLQDYQGAIEDFDKAIELNSGYAEAHYNRGVTKFALQDYKGAIEDYTKAIEIDTNYIEAYHNRGVLLSYYLND